ncbi:hypothetical protein BDQ17DRAFT_1490321 [Cyathus striatus]|nr:hypothetical protein BDQ17DRAFT_1490321 [Cyathus striatus]
MFSSCHCLLTASLCCPPCWIQAAATASTSINSWPSPLATVHILLAGYNVRLLPTSATTTPSSLPPVSTRGHLFAGYKPLYPLLLPPPRRQYLCTHGHSLLTGYNVRLPKPSQPHPHPPFRTKNRMIDPDRVDHQLITGTQKSSASSLSWLSFTLQLDTCIYPPQLGTGLSKVWLTKNVNPETPWGFPSLQITIASLLSGTLVAFLTRHGTGHTITPSHVPARANIATPKSFGRHRLREEIRPRDFALPSEIIDCTKGIRPLTNFDGSIVAHVMFGNPFSGKFVVWLEERDGGSDAYWEDYCVYGGPAV